MIEKITDKQREQICAHIQLRQAPIKREAINEETRTVEISFSSEMPVMRWYGLEVLSHDPKAIRMERWKGGAPLLMDHNMRDQRGIIENGALIDKNLKGTARISKHDRGEELWMDMKDGIRKDVSIGYAVHNIREMKTDEMTPEMQKMCLENKCGCYMVEDWEPLEGSSVSIPADTTVGIGRSLEEYYNFKEPAEQKGAGQQSTTITTGERTMEPTTQAPAPPAPALTEEEKAKREQERKKEIEAVAERFKTRIRGGEKAMQQLVKDAIELKRDEELFRGDIYLRVVDGEPIETPETDLDLSERDKKRYSICRAILSLEPNSKAGGFERECSDAIAKRLNKQPQGIFVPNDIQRRQNTEIPPHVQAQIETILRRSGIGERALTVGTPTAGGNLVATNLLAGSFIDLLRAKLLMAKLGVPILDGLVGNVAIPKQTGASTAYYVSEAADVTESAPTFGQVAMSPKTVGAYNDLSRLLLLQSTPAADALVIDDLTRVIGLAIDKAVPHGSGGTQPTGIVGTSGVGAVDGTGFGWPQAVEFETDVAEANADAATMGFVMRPSVRGTLKERLKALNTGFFLISDDGKLNGYPVFTSTQILAAHIIFGDWAQVLIGLWGILDLKLDPYALSKSGGLRVVALQSFDVAVRQAGAFSVCTNLS